MKIKDGMFRNKNGECPLFQVGWRVDMPCNAHFRLLEEVREREIQQIAASGEYLFIEAYSALLYRKQAADGRDTGLKKTKWWKGSLEASMKYFFTSEEAFKIQLKEVEKVIDLCLQYQVNFAFSLLWEAQVLKNYQPFYQWFSKFRNSLKAKYTNTFPVGLHSHIRKQYRLADFVMVEGNYAPELFKHDGDPDCPVIIVSRNPGVWPSGKPENYKLGYDSNKLEWIAKEQHGAELVRYGCTGHLYPRWLNLNILNVDVKAKADLSKYNPLEMDKNMTKFYRETLKRIKKADRRTLDFAAFADLTVKPVEEKPEPEPKPNPDPEKDKKTGPISAIEKEVKMNFFKKNWKTIRGTLLRTLHGWLIPIYGMACKYIHINGFALFVIGIVLALIVFIIEDRVYG